MNPFADDIADLVTLGTKVMSDKIVESIRAAEEVGTAQHQTFVKDQLTDSSKPLYEPILKNNFPLFKSRLKKGSKASK